MNREQRRSMANGSKKADGALKYLESPCSITEAVQIARGVAEDVVTDYEKRTRSLQVAISLQLDIMKKLMIEKGMITEEEFKSLYLAAAEDFKRRHEEALNQQREETPEEPKMSVSAGNIEVEVQE